MKYALRCFVKILGLRGIDILELLRIAINEREPSALHLHHDPVTLLECVVNVQQREVDARGLTGLHGGRLAEASAKFAPHDIAAHEFLKGSHVRRYRCDSGTRWSADVFGMDVDELDDPIGVRSARRDDKPRLDRTNHSDVFGERSALIRQNIRPVRRKSLILSHVVFIHVKPTIGNEGDWMLWIADIFVISGASP